MDFRCKLLLWCCEISKMSGHIQQVGLASRKKFFDSAQLESRAVHQCGQNKKCLTLKILQPSLPAHFSTTFVVQSEEEQNERRHSGEGADDEEEEVDKQHRVRRSSATATRTRSGTASRPALPLTRVCALGMSSMFYLDPFHRLIIPLKASSPCLVLPSQQYLVWYMGKKQKLRSNPPECTPDH